MQIQSLLNNPAISVFLGTLPLLGGIIWTLLQNERSLKAIDKRLDVMDSRLGRIETRLDQLETKLSNLSERVTRIVTRLEGKQVVLS